ncbi:MAG: NAD(P)H-hydrate dehydratase [Propionibacteriaceae bacterium]|nr:NAD(P)H-hydrate dehydratase [Propionibacteriaceae bacterium]
MAPISLFSFVGLAGSWPRFERDADKYARGVVGLMTGSQRFPGAGLLTVLGAVNSGAGFVRYCGADAAHAAILTRVPSVTFGAGRVGAWVAGSGWDEQDLAGNQQRWAQVTKDDVPVVVDAGALEFAKDGCPTGSLLTPHAGELARLLDVERSGVEAEPVEHALQAARQFQTTVLLKGHIQYVATPAGKVTQPQEGTSWTARAGSGDVLAGMAGTLLAQGVGAEMAGLLAAGMQAYVSTRHMGPYTPDRMAEFLPEHIGELMPSGWAPRGWLTGR